MFEFVCSAISEDEKEVMRQKLIADFSEPANQVQKIVGNDNFLRAVLVETCSLMYYLCGQRIDVIECKL